VLALLSLYGSVGGSNCVLNRAAETLPRNPKVGAVLNELRTLIARLQETVSAMPALILDLADLASFDYHSGLIFRPT